MPVPSSASWYESRPITYADIHAPFVSADLTVTTGTAPSICVLQAVATDDVMPPIGDLTIRDSETNNTIYMPDCAINKSTGQITTSSDMLTYQLMDRRWRWSLSEPVTALYNSRNADESIIESTKAKLSEIASKLFEILGEASANVEVLLEIEKTDEGKDSKQEIKHPFIDWIDVDPRSAINDLLLGVGCTLVPALSGDFKVVKIGEGDPLPSGGVIDDRVVNVSAGFETTVQPQKICVSGQLIKYQAKFRLEAVGVEPVSGYIVPIDQLSYNPANQAGAETLATSGAPVSDGFQEPLNMSDVLALDRSLGPWREGYWPDAEPHTYGYEAQKTVYRWYRIAGLAHSDDDDKNPIPRIDSTNQILPLEDGLIETEFVVNEEMAGLVGSPEKKGAQQVDVGYGLHQPRSAYVDGIFLDGMEDAYNVSPGTVCNVSFVLDKEMGIVKFAEPVCMKTIATDEDGLKYFKYNAADLRLTCCFSIRGKVDDKHGRHQFGGSTRHYSDTLWEDEKGRAIGYGVSTVRQADFQSHVRILYKKPVQSDFKGKPRDTMASDGIHSVITNDEKLEAIAKDVIEKKKKSFAREISKTARYVGIVPIELSGTIQQVQYSVSNSGTMTTASANTEHDRKVVSISEMRESARIARLEQRANNLKAAKKRHRSGN